VVEMRRYARTPINVSVEFTPKDEKRALSGVATDISLGGMFIETKTPAAFNASIVVRLRLPGQKEDTVIPATVRWTRADGMGLQFGLTGVRDTHAITELVKKAEQAQETAAKKKR
jgi:hypothetical protein